MIDIDNLNVGREELRPFVVAVKGAIEEWSAKFDLALMHARASYCAGTHEMCQGRDGPVIIQYLIPRKVPVEAREFPRATVREDRA